MPPPRYPYRPIRRAAALAILAALALAPAGCGCRPAPKPPPAPDPAPVEAPAPIPDPAPPKGDADGEDADGEDAPPEAGSVRHFTEEVLRGVRFGMSPEALSALLGVPGQAVAKEGEAVEVLRYVDDTGVAVMARFEGGRLMRKNLARPETEAAMPAEEAPSLTEERYHEARAGMPLAEVEALFGLPPAMVSAGADGMAIYRWSDAHGASFTARFDHGLLTRKTGFYVARRDADRAEDAEAPDDAADWVEAEGGAEGEGEDPGLAPEPGGIRIAADPDAAPREESDPAWEEEPDLRAPQPVADRVRVARRPPVVDPATGEEARPVSPNRERRTRARLPEFRRSLRAGDYEVRIVNNGSSPIRAGIRSPEGGRDLGVPGGQARSVRVGRGTYTVYFIHDDDPQTLHQGRAVTIDGAYTTDLEIRVMAESYAVDHLRVDPGY